MEHGKKNRKFGRETKPRQALIRSLAVALIDHKRIKTTEAKAKSLRVFFEKLITTAKSGNLAQKRKVISMVGLKAAKHLINKVVPSLQERKGGYLRIIKLPPRVGDGAKLALIEIIK